MLLILRNYKVLLGFISSSGVVLITSLVLSGFTGLKALINLWASFSTGIATNSPERMINWRMLGVNLNSNLNTSLGWMIIGVGIILTLLVVYFLIKHNPPFGSTHWVMTVLGIFSATLAITWHSHYHMAVILIPFLVYALTHELLSENTLYLWVVTTPVAWFAIGMIGLLVFTLAKINILNYQVLLIAFSGFAVNLALLVSIIKSIYSQRAK